MTMVKTKNGIDVDQLVHTIEAIQEDPSLACLHSQVGVRDA